MTSVVQPDLIPQPWSQSGSHTTIPDTTSEFGRASWSLGFPPETALPLNAGGIPPNWLDFQGVLYALSQHAIFEQAGGRYAWNTDTNYPAGACIIGSNGVVYQALQESGPGTSAGAKNPTSSGSSAYWGPLATPDGSTIKLTNGKLAVNLSGVADGTTIVANNNKLSVSPSGIADGTTIIDNGGKLTAVGGGGGGDASTLVDNKTTVAQNGKITVDLSNAPALSLHGISPYLALTNGGLAVDQTTGKLLVDFENMPTDKFEALLHSLHIPLWVGENGIGTEFYVDDANGIDSTADARGRSAAKPWKTIGYATQQICQNYNINSYSVHINVKGGTYSGLVSLPMQQRTTGNIVIRPATSDDVVNIAVEATAGQRIFTHSGGVWYVDDLNITLTLGEQTSANTTFPAVLYSTSSGESVHMRHCSYTFVDNTVTPVSGTYGSVSAAMLWAPGGQIFIENKDETGKRSATWTGSASKADVTWLKAENGGSILVGGGVSQPYTFNISGDFGTFCGIGAHSFYSNRSSNRAIWNAVNSPSGKRYAAYAGGTISTGASTPATYFPGNIAGTVDSNTYSWIN